MPPINNMEVLMLKPLNQNEFTMKIVKDLGMKKPTENYYKKVRMAVFECCNCKQHFEAVVSTKSKTQKHCRLCNNVDKIKPNRNHKLYRTWADTKHKLHAKENTSHYKTYVLKGITMCDEWLNSYNKFFEWAINNGWKEELTLDRIDNNKGYFPENCRWVNMNVQLANQNLKSTNTTGYKGVTKLGENRFNSCIRYNNIVYTLGIYTSALEAAKAYDSFIKLMNFPHISNNVLKENEIIYPKNKKTLSILKNKGIYISNDISKEP